MAVLADEGSGVLSAELYHLDPKFLQDFAGTFGGPGPCVGHFAAFWWACCISTAARPRRQDRKQVLKFTWPGYLCPGSNYVHSLDAEQLGLTGEKKDDFELLSLRAC